MNTIIPFPKFISFTLTNVCNLKCKMCGQWSESGYMKDYNTRIPEQMMPDDWERLMDEVAKHQIKSILFRGGEPFLYKDINRLLDYAIKKEIFVSVDTNGTVLHNHADKIVELENIHLTVSIDGPENIHDEVRGVQGTFRKIKNNLDILKELEKKKNIEISKSMTFTISHVNYKHLGVIPHVARELGIKKIAVVPYFYMTEGDGKKYIRQMKEVFDCDVFTWSGFHHENSGVNYDEFKKQYDLYLKNLGEIENFPYMPLTPDEYKKWFENTSNMVGQTTCNNVEKLIDIQPDGNANFCVDSPDFSIGNVKNQSIHEIWNSKRAKHFRNYRRIQPLAVCYRCVAKHMADLVE